MQIRKKIFSLQDIIQRGIGCFINTLLLPLFGNEKNNLMQIKGKTVRVMMLFLWFFARKSGEYSELHDDLQR